MHESFIQFGSIEKKRRVQSQSIDEINKQYCNAIDIWSLFPNTSNSNVNGNDGAKNTYKWKLVIIVDDLLQLPETYRAKMAWIQRWIIRKLSKGNVGKCDSSVSTVLSSYTVSISTNDDREGNKGFSSEDALEEDDAEM